MIEMPTRTETIPAGLLHLAEGERVARSEVKNGQIVVTIATNDVRDRTRKAGKEFLEFSRKMRETAPIDLDKLAADTDPRVRAILDDCDS